MPDVDIKIQITQMNTSVSFSHILDKMEILKTSKFLNSAGNFIPWSNAAILWEKCLNQSFRFLDLS